MLGLMNLIRVFENSPTWRYPARGPKDPGRGRAKTAIAQRLPHVFIARDQRHSLPIAEGNPCALSSPNTMVSQLLIRYHFLFFLCEHSVSFVSRPRRPLWNLETPHHFGRTPKTSYNLFFQSHVSKNCTSHEAQSCPGFERKAMNLWVVSRSHAHYSS